MNPYRFFCSAIAVIISITILGILWSEKISARTDAYITRPGSPQSYWTLVAFLSFFDIIFIVVAIFGRNRKDGEF